MKFELPIFFLRKIESVYDFYFCCVKQTYNVGASCSSSSSEILYPVEKYYDKEFQRTDRSRSWRFIIRCRAFCRL